MKINRLAADTVDLVHQVSAAIIVQVGDHHLGALTPADSDRQSYGGEDLARGLCSLLPW